jgi:hypothetical protein
MNRYSLLLFLLAVFAACDRDPGQSTAKPTELQIDSVTGDPIYPANPWENAGCTLLTDEEVEDLFAIDARAATLNTRSLPDKAFCLRTWNKPDWKERENHNEKGSAPYLDPQNRLIIQVIDYHTPAVAADQFEIVRRERRATYEEDVDGLGEGAFWSSSTSTLLIRKDRFAVSISLEHVDTPHDNLAKAKEVAAVILKKMDD